MSGKLLLPDLKSMTEKSSKSKILAHWHFTKEQWNQYLYHEKLAFESNTFVDVRKILTFGVAVLVLIAIMGAAKGGPAVFFFVLIAGSLFFGFCYLIHRAVRKVAEQRLHTLTGEVKVTKLRVDINGVIYDWRGKWSLPQIRKEYVDTGMGKMLFLKFICTGSMFVRGSRHPIEKKFLVPVQPGKESEADFIITEITENYFKK
jgi:hypothetical protein